MYYIPFSPHGLGGPSTGPEEGRIAQKIFWLLIAALIFIGIVYAIHEPGTSLFVAIGIVAIGLMLVLGAVAALVAIVDARKRVVQKEETLRQRHQEREREDSEALSVAILAKTKTMFRDRFPQLDTKEGEKIFKELLKRGRFEVPQVKRADFREDLLSMEVPSSETGILRLKYADTTLLSATVFQEQGRIKVL